METACPTCHRPYSESRRCIDCTRSFEIAAGEIAFFERKGFRTPLRCPPCRKAKREAMEYRDLHREDR
jgi:hypothetical protein